ncbi:MAG: SDR family NAD(P)-dependent oxidoreductase [Acidobacteria bacterium]|nr:SDR family NAD(P)-dependent oxidoreductase [Acidobacteriota bacterium]
MPTVVRAHRWFWLSTVVVVAVAAGLRWTSAQAPADNADVKGKIVLITGSTDGLGREVARRTAARGAHVIVHGRNQERGKAVVDEITKDGAGTARFYAADFALLDDVRTFAAAIRRDYDRIDVLVNNAGVLLRDRQVSRDGHELQFAVNYLAGFLLTRTLLPIIGVNSPARIINVSSLAQSPIDFDDVMLERPGRAAQGYGQSKLAQILFTMDLATELKDRPIIVTALHPATMMDTTMVRQSGMPSRSTVDEGATALMQQIAGATVESGRFYNGLNPARPNAQAEDVTARAKLRELSVKLTGVK